MTGIGEKQHPRPVSTNGREARADPGFQLGHPGVEGPWDNGF